MSPDGYLRCPRCNELLPEGSLVTTCASCLNQAYLEETMAHEGELSGDMAALKIEVAQDLKKLKHITFLADRTLAYCGVRPVRTPTKRQRVLVKDLPPGVCSICLARFLKTMEPYRVLKETLK